MNKEVVRHMAVKLGITLVIGIPATTLATVITKLVNQHLILPLTEDILKEIASSKS